MACYHFTMKLDRKPDKTPVNAAMHLEYIHRTGKFKNIDFRRAIELQEFSGNMLCPPKEENTEAVRRLYQSVYGSLIDNGIGIEASDGASVETLQIALSLATKKYGSLLNVSGSTEYKARVLVAASEMDLNVTFTEDAMNHEYSKLKEKIENGRSKSEGSRREGEQQTGIHIPNLKPVRKRRPPRRGNGLQILSKCCVDAKQKQGNGMLLQDNYAISVEHGQENRHRALRRDLSESIRAKAERTADEILRRSQGAIPAVAHLEYINRQEDYAAKGGCIYTSHYLPKWAEGSPRKFFQAADRYERANGTRYREIEFALPNELSLEAQKEIISKFIDQHLKDFYYAYAVHDKIGAMSSGERNTHVHIMFSERKIDEYERIHEREPEHFFKQANKKMPERGGCAKDPKWNGRERMEYLCQMREDFAMIQNAVLEKYGITDRVDHRSLREQMADAVKSGNLQLARLLDRLPEPHIGPASAKEKGNRKVADLMAYRAYKMERNILIQAANKLENELDDESCKRDGEKINQDMSKVEASEKANLSSVASLKYLVIDRIREISALESVIIRQKDADLMAQEKYMTIEERRDFRDYHRRIHERDELEALRKSLVEMPEALAGETVNTQEILLKKIADDQEVLAASIEALRPKVLAIEERMSSPNMKNMVDKEAARIMRNDFPQRKRLKELQKEVRSLMPRLQEAVFPSIEQDALRMIRKSEEKTSFTAKEIRAYLKESYIVCARDYKIQQRLAEQLKKKVISLERATAMAKNVYTKGAYKELRKEKRKLENEKTKLDSLWRDFKEKEAEFTAKPKPRWYQDSTSYRKQEDEIEVQRRELIALENDWRNRSDSCQGREKELDDSCMAPAAQDKIAAITKGILRKNTAGREQYLAASKKAGTLYEKMKRIQLLQKGIERQIAIDGKKDIAYALSPMAGNSHSGAKTGRAVSGEERILAIAQAIKAGKNANGGSIVIRLDTAGEELDFDALDQTDREAEMEKSERLLR